MRTGNVGSTRAVVRAKAGDGSVPGSCGVQSVPSDRSTVTAFPAYAEPLGAERPARRRSPSPPRSMTARANGLLAGLSAVSGDHLVKLILREVQQQLCCAP